MDNHESSPASKAAEALKVDETQLVPGGPEPDYVSISALVCGELEGDKATKQATVTAIQRWKRWWDAYEAAVQADADYRADPYDGTSHLHLLPNEIREALLTRCLDLPNNNNNSAQ